MLRNYSQILFYHFTVHCWAEAQTHRQPRQTRVAATSLFFAKNLTFLDHKAVLLSLFLVSGMHPGLLLGFSSTWTSSAAIEYMCHTVTHASRQWHCDAKVLMFVAFSRGSLLDECNLIKKERKKKTQRNKTFDLFKPLVIPKWNM